MVHTLDRFKVNDFDKWKPIFDRSADFRKANGAIGGHMFRNSADRNEVIVITEFDSLENARKFSQSEELRKRQAAAGVTGREIIILEEVEKIKG